MSTIDIISISLSVITAIAFGTMFITVLAKAIKPKKPQNGTHPRTRWYLIGETL